MSRRDRALVRDASDEGQVRHAERVERMREEQRRAAYAFVMASPAGRFVMWDLILATGVFKTLWTPSAELHAKTAVRDFGLVLMQQLQVSEPELFQLMEREWWTRDKRENQQTDAAHTPSSTAGGDNDGR